MQLRQDVCYQLAEAFPAEAGWGPSQVEHHPTQTTPVPFRDPNFARALNEQIPFTWTRLCETFEEAVSQYSLGPAFDLKHSFASKLLDAKWRKRPLGNISLKVAACYATAEGLENDSQSLYFSFIVTKLKTENS